ncbi:lipopolysaccharide heptosyltransferase I [Polynucleobacter antarcticus]|uniref:Lipopolysaccharide heptosyltransferase 1 n=1 Tax=Polynucleobacter antarcticus TaxID=1743162 RepID=A0A6M9PMV4_9BURK|nr:lipopolysaccharide heptosyltransferase I [Polynucleobacter antarcticus]QKM61889.1 lipopolysaccharide heptosyltransferase I [Polynucleobacter antarcticus]
MTSQQPNPLSTAALAPKILLVKLSSLGDVLHNLPIVWDLRKRLPNAQIDWIVEEAYVHLLEPLKTTHSFKGIDRIIPIALRRWRKNLFSIQTWREFFAMRKLLQSVSYDTVIETQGLLKSALVCSLANKSKDAVVSGLGNATEYSGYEPMARFFYTQSVQVPVKCHAIDRSRWVMCSAFNWPLIDRTTEAPQFYSHSFVTQLSPLITEGLRKDPHGLPVPYVLCFHSTARVAKRWPNDHWIALGKELSNHGYQLVFPWGNEAEKKESTLIASQIPGAIVPRAFSIEEAYQLVAHAALTIGVDTGLTHLSAVLGKPTVEIYCDSPKWKTEGYWSGMIANVGDYKKVPNLEEVMGVTCLVSSDHFHLETWTPGFKLLRHSDTNSSGV